MRVSLMLTCLCDAFYGEVGIAAVRVLEHAGCIVQFDEEQTCCGQPPFNAGDWPSAKRIAEHTLSVLGRDRAEGTALVCPSVSCAAMVRHGYEMLWPDRKKVHCYEVAEFLIEVMGIAEWPRASSDQGKLAFHSSCHSRMLHWDEPAYPQRLLGIARGIEFVDFEQQEQCCGFGGAFAATHPHLSAGIGMEKLAQIAEAGASVLVSADMGCLMHLDGLIRRHQINLRARHYLEVLADCLPARVGAGGASK